MRGDLAVFMGKNIVHASDSLASADQEMKLFFMTDELFEYMLPHEDCLYD